MTYELSNNLRIIITFWSLFGFISDTQAADNEFLVADRLIYVFSPDVTGHEQRVVYWSNLAKESKKKITVIFFDREKIESTDFPQSVIEIIGSRFNYENSDYALLYDSYSSRPLFSGTGEEVAERLKVQTVGNMATDVDESTWGKIKELFQ
tara:strand:+ start:755 stop:1207 length:453 start_codon:yes stop_codon:yes gene_type:complete